MGYRAVQFVIQPVIVHDDGEHLTPVAYEPVTVSAKEIDTFGQRFAEHLAERDAKESIGGTS